MLMRARSSCIGIALLALATAGCAGRAHSPIVEGATSLCMADEVVVFACGLEKKQVELCGVGDFYKPGASLRYRFGTPGHVEMEYPAPGIRPEFSMEDSGWVGPLDANQENSGGGQTLLWFSQGQRDFVLFSRMVRAPFNGPVNETRRASGLLVVNQGQFESVQTCTDPAVLPVLPAEVAPLREFPHEMGENLPPTY